MTWQGIKVCFIFVGSTNSSSRGGLMKSSSFGAQTLGSRISSSSPKSIPGIGLWAFWRCCFVYLLTSRISSGLWSGSRVGRDDWGVQPMGNGNWGASAPWGF